MATTLQKADHISQVRSAVDTLLAGMAQLRALRREWDALGLGSAITQADMTGEHEGLSVADIAGVYTTMDAIDGLMAQGHATNLYKAAH